MSDAPGRRFRPRRETTLLIVTLTVSALVLLLLAQLRFPEAPGIVETAAQPLDRLAARASYDELAAGVARVEASVFPNLIVLRLAAPEEDAPRRLGDVLTMPARDAGVRYVPALRTSGITAVAALGPDDRVTGVVGRNRESTGVARVIAADPLRRLALVNVPQAPVRPLSSLPILGLDTPAYVVAIEGTSAGITARPIFLGNRDRYVEARWTRPLLPLGGSAVTPGALIFSLNGEFIGAVVNEGGTLAIVEASDVFETTDRLAGGGTAPADAGLSVQALTPELAIATGASTGIVVSDVDPAGAAAGLVLPGDVITRIDSEAVTSTEQLLLRIAAFDDGDGFTLGLLRDSEPLTAEVVLGADPGDAAATSSAEPGQDLEAADGGVLVRAVAPGSPLDEAGVLPGDLVLRVRTRDGPSPGELRDALAETEPGDFALLIVRREGRQRVLAVPGVLPPDAPQ